MHKLKLKSVLVFAFASLLSNTAFSNETAPAIGGAALVEAKGCVACHGKDGNGVILATRTSPVSKYVYPLRTSA